MYVKAFKKAKTSEILLEKVTTELVQNTCKASGSRMLKYGASIIPLSATVLSQEPAVQLLCKCKITVWQKQAKYNATMPATYNGNIGHTTATFAFIICLTFR